MRCLEPAFQSPAATAPRLRIIARLAEDGRIEHGVEFSGGEQVMPDVRYLAGDATPGVWHTSSDVEMDESSIGKIRTRRLGDGRVELGFVNTGGEAISPEIRFLSADLASGIWIRSSEIEVPAETTLSE